MWQRTTLTRQPLAGDYILRSRGCSWAVHRSNGNGAVFIISEGDRDRREALGKVFSLCDADRVDAWETAGTGEFWRLRQSRPD
jgi:hypothetical protein